MVPPLPASKAYAPAPLNGATDRSAAGDTEVCAAIPVGFVYRSRGVVYGDRKLRSRRAGDKVRRAPADENKKAPVERGPVSRRCADAQATFFLPAMVGATALAVAVTVLSVISATCLPALVMAS